MEVIKKIEKKAYAIKIYFEDTQKKVGRVTLYVLYNELHEQPFGYMEDLFVDEEFRGQGVGQKLVEALVAAAKEEGCYKILFTSRDGRDGLHAWYEKLGFKNWGREFRMDLA